MSRLVHAKGIHAVSDTAGLRHGKSRCPSNLGTLERCPLAVDCPIRCDPNPVKESGAGASVPGGKEREGYALIGIKGSSGLSSSAGGETEKHWI